MDTHFNHTEDYTKEEIALRSHFLRQAYPQPDPDKEMADFWERQERADRKRQRIVYLSAILSAAAILCFVFLFFHGKEPKLIVPQGAVVAYKAQTEGDIKDVTLQKGDEKPQSVGNKLSVVSTASHTSTINTLMTPSSATAEITLSDGTEVWLNADSKLVYPEHFSSKTREVTLTGEAYFNVAHDAAHPFIVRTAGVSTKVLGTEFNVKAYKPNDTHITLIEGKVQLSTQHALCDIIPGEDATFNGKALHVSEVDTERFTAWRNGDFYFDNETFLSIAQEIGRWYNVSVVFNDPEKMNTRLFFAAPKNDGIQDIVEILNSLNKGKVTYHDNQISID